MNAPQLEELQDICSLAGEKGHPKAGGKKKATINTNAPAGGGGPGGFRDPHCLNGPTDAAATACSHTPALRHAAHKADPAGTSAAAPKPPPATVPSCNVFAKKQSGSEDVEVYLEILADTTDSSLASGSAKTSFSFEQVSFSTPGYEYSGHTVTKLTGKFEAKGAITIQTAYGPGAKPSDRSGYGRGTTTEDEKAGNVSLGFHESCHRQDYLDYLAQHPLPHFTGKVGTPVHQFQAAGPKVGADLEKYRTEMGAVSEKKTDEVGYKLSEFEKKGPRKP